MFGQNLKRAPVIGEGKELEIKSIFKTLQGEGPFVGRPSIFIRLGGCNLACSFCDTDFEDFMPVTVKDILEQVIYLSEKKIKLVVITGGEPLRQPIELLCKKLIKAGFIVQIETNGTIYRNLPQEVHIVCSPKPLRQGYKRIREDLLPQIDAIKFLVAKNLPPYTMVAEIGQSDYNIPVFVQPIDQNDERLNKENTALAIQIALDNDYRLSYQIHKILGIE